MRTRKHKLNSGEILTIFRQDILPEYIIFQEGANGKADREGREELFQQLLETLIEIGDTTPEIAEKTAPAEEDLTFRPTEEQFARWQHYYYHIINTDI